MKDKRHLSNRFKISKFKLDSLLDIPTEELLSKYESILRDSLGIGKILILKRSNIWECLMNEGFPKHLETIDVESKLLDYDDITYVSAEMEFEGVDIILPVFNNNVHLAFIFIGDIEEEGEGMSPVLKHLTFIQTISTIIIVAIENIRLHKESLRQEALKKELELAARMQKMLIPDNSHMPRNHQIVVTGFYYPHYEVGGDYYDCIKLSDTKTGLCIADVSGKGMSAALLMSNFQASLRALLTADIHLETLIHKLNSIVNSNAAGESFITFFIARYDHREKTFEYINAAHNAPVLYYTESNEVVYLDSTCVGLGMLDEIPVAYITEVRIKGYSKLICYTDGLSELKGEDGKDIGTREIVRHISNNDPVEKNLEKMFRYLGIPDTNPYLFDDVSIIAADLR